MKSTIANESAIMVTIIFGNRNDTIKAVIFESVRGKVAIRPIRPAKHKWEAAKRHLLATARGCFKGSTNNGSLVSTLEPGWLMEFLHKRGTIAL